MKYLYKLTIVSAIVFSLLTIVSAQVEQDKAVALKRLSGNKIIGAWRVNTKESDNTISKLEAAMRNMPPELGDEGSKSPPISVSLMPPQSLILAGDNESITINEGFADFIMSRTVSTDGIIHTRNIAEGAQSKIRAVREDGSLKVEVISPRGNTLKETYTLENNGNKLIVTLRFENEYAAEMLTLRRVYDRATIDLFDIDSASVR